MKVLNKILKNLRQNQVQKKNEQHYNNQLKLKFSSQNVKKMERKKKQTYCLVCRDYTKSINPKIVRNRQNRYIIQSNCATCGSKKSRFIKEQKALGILSNLGI